MKQMWELTIQTDFSAAHQLRHYQGKCEHLHGHNWRVEITVRCRELDNRGIAVDFNDLKNAARQVMEKLDHTLLNELEIFAGQNPSAENVARYVHQELSQIVNTANNWVWRVCVHETPGCAAAYLEERDG